MTRAFTSAPAVRRNVPLLIALIGPSTSGKTFSAHRLAAGIARVQPGEVFGISTEGARMLELADRFKFRHIPFDAPFGSLDYLAAIKQAEAEGAKTIIVDSMSDEHEGPGGCLDTAHEIVEEKIRRKVEFKDLKSADGYEADKAREKLNKGSWIKPKADRNRLIQYLYTGLKANLILCFRAREKIDGKSNDFKMLGWQPIAGDEFWYAMTARCLLKPGADGVPDWNVGGLEKGEKIMVRRPEQFEKILRTGAQLSEDMGEAMARWAAGGAAGAPGKPAGDKAKALAAIAGAGTNERLDAVREQLDGRAWADGEREALDAAYYRQRTALGMTNSAPLEREPGSDDE